MRIKGNKARGKLHEQKNKTRQKKMCKDTENFHSEIRTYIKSPLSLLSKFFMNWAVLLPHKHFAEFFVIVCLVSDDIRDNSSLDLNKFIRDELQPNEEFHRPFNDAVDSLYQELQTDLQGTEYAIHNLIKVGGQTAPLPSPEKWVVKKDAGEKVSL